MNNTFGGFEAVAAALTKTPGSSNPDTNEHDYDNPNIPEVDPEELEDDSRGVRTPVDSNVDDITSNGEVEVPTDDDEDEVVKDTTEEEDSTDTTAETEETDLSEYEEDITGFVVDRLSQELGWDLGEEGKEFGSVGDIVDYIKEIVETNSQPVYPNDEIAELSKFVENGGNLKHFFDQVYDAEVDFDSADITSESTQKTVLKEYLKTQGYTPQRIEKKIERYEDSGVLEEEAEEALEYLKGYKKEQKETLLKQQENLKKQAAEQQQKFMSDVESTIKSLDNVRGLSLTEKEKKQLLDYIFVPDNSGMSKYQKEYQENLAKNLIESAFFTMKGDKFVQKMERNATSKAAKTLANKLKSKNRRRNTPSDDSEISLESLLNSASNVLIKKP